MRTAEEIKEDIQTVRNIVDDIKTISWKLGENGLTTNPVIASVVSKNYSHGYKSVAMWLYHGAKECFLQDADNLIMKAKDLVEILRFLRGKFPELKRVTTYSRAKTISRKSISELKEIKEAGLDRVHIGLESGYDPVLKFMNKGVTAKQHVEAGTKIINSGMSLSEYVMPGLGGEEMWKEHAVETAKVLNLINPQYIRLRSLRIHAVAPLYKKLKNKEFKMPTDDQVVDEIRLFIETLDDTLTSSIVSDHIMNLLEEVKGKFPEEKDAMLNVIKKYQNLPEQERIIYRIGRRGGVFTSTDDLINDKSTYDKISRLALELSKKGPDEVEVFINRMADSYI